MAVVKMNRITLLGPYNNKEQVLEEIQRVGVVDIIEKEKEEFTQLKETIVLDKIEKSIKFLKRYENAFSSEDEIPDVDTKSIENIEDTEELCDDILAWEDEIENMENQIVNLQKAISTQLLWGDFDFNEIKELRDKYGIHMQFWSAPDMKKVQLEEEQTPIVINKDKKHVYFITLSTEPYEDIPLCNEAVFYYSVEELKSMLENDRKKLREDKAKLYLLNKRIYDRLIQDKVDYMNKAEYKKAMFNLDEEIEGNVYIINGWCPTENLADLEKSMNNYAVLMFIDEPTLEDNVPVSIRNGSFTRLFEPITNFFKLPDYFELDLTAFFAPLFWLFFGLCLGDAGYGGIILIISAVGVFITDKPNVRRLLMLGVLFGFSTVVVGLVLTGSLLGFNTLDIPILKELVIYENTEIQRMAFFNLALLIGVIQIFIGLIANAINTAKQEGLSLALYPLGTLIFNAGLVILLAPQLVPDFPIPMNIGFICLIAGLPLILLFNSRGNVFKRFGLGLWELYNVVTGFFGDVLSYLRLFALGLAGSTLGFVVNVIGQNFLGIPIPVVNFIVYFIFIIIFHTIMLALNALGAFVHPLRLTFVEFYKNAGFKGTSNYYNPFAMRRIEEEKA